MFDEQLIFAQRAAELAAPTAHFALLEQSTHVLVNTGGQHFALALQDLRAASRQPIARVPLSPPEWVGVTHYMEQFWPVRWLGPPQDRTGPSGFVLFLRGRGLGLLVEEHLGLTTVPAAPPLSRPEPMTNGLDFLTVAFTLADGTRVIEMSRA